MSEAVDVMNVNQDSGTSLKPTLMDVKVSFSANLFDAHDEFTKKWPGKNVIQFDHLYENLDQLVDLDVQFRN